MRLGGPTRPGWLALRLSLEPGSDDIRREAHLASLLSPEAGYPQIIETGVAQGHEWSLAREVPGRNLGELWPSLGWDGRIAALRQLWGKAEAVHGVSASAAAEFTIQVA